MTGQIFGRLTVIRKGKGIVQSNGKRIADWYCKCQCGNELTVNGRNLRKGYSKSCGCLRKELIGNRFRSHGYTGTPEYNTWCSMNQRCNDANSPSYGRYGGRGIKVCDRWMKFENFLEDMGERPSKQHSIDRIENNLGYFKENCEWATVTEQCNNRRNNRTIIFNNRSMTLRRAMREYGCTISMKNVRQRVFMYGWSVERAMSEPVDFKSKPIHDRRLKK